MAEAVAPEFGFSEADLRSRATAYAPGLFSGRVVIVTGAGGGLGRAIAALFARLGATLAICGRNPEKLETAAAFLRSFGGEVLARQMSVRDPEQVAAFVDEVEAAYGRIDVLVNNAGGQFPQAAIDYSAKGWNAVIDTNLNGTWWMMQATARKWFAHKTPGVIVNIVADVWRGLPGIAHTCAARAGIIYLSKSVAVEWAPNEIRVNCVAPGCCESTGLETIRRKGRAPSRSRIRCGAPGTSGTWPKRWSTWPVRRPSSSPARCSRWTAASSSGAIPGRPGGPNISGLVEVAGG